MIGSSLQCQTLRAGRGRSIEIAHSPRTLPGHRRSRRRKRIGATQHAGLNRHHTDALGVSAHERESAQSPDSRCGGAEGGCRLAGVAV